MKNYELTGLVYYRKNQRDGGGQGDVDLEESFKARDDAQAERKTEKIIEQYRGSMGKDAGFELELKEVRIVKRISIEENI